MWYDWHQHKYSDIAKAVEQETIQQASSKMMCTEITASSSKSCLIRNPDSSSHLDRKHAYYYQVQTQIFVCKAKYCDFCGCTFPDNAWSKLAYREDLWGQRILDELYRQNSTFLQIPELIAKWYTKPLSLLSLLLLRLSAIGITSLCSATAGILDSEKDHHRKWSPVTIQIVQLNGSIQSA